jgi:hypothetical protein
MTNDPVIDEIREVRHRISARFNHDPSKLVAYYMDLQERYSDRLIKEPESENRGSSEAREGKASSAQS